MDYKRALEKLEALREALQKEASVGASSELQAEISIRYGEVEEIIDRVVGINEINVPLTGKTSMTCRNYIEAGYLSGRTMHTDVGYYQLLKVIGKVKQLAESEPLPAPPSSISSLVRTLGMFRECCQYLQQPPKNEKDVQDIVWIMLRSQFDRVDREDTLPRFGTKSYRPDFGLPDLAVLVEIKFIGSSTNPGSIQEGILADVPGYLQESGRYTGIVVVVYDAAHKLLDPRKFIEDLRKVDGILDVIVVPGVGYKD